LLEKDFLQDALVKNLVNLLVDVVAKQMKEIILTCISTIKDNHLLLSVLVVVDADAGVGADVDVEVETKEICLEKKKLFSKVYVTL
jgi:hypothetical protein